MTSSIAAVFGSTGITWSGLTVSFGILTAVLLAYALYTAHSGRGRGIWLLFCFSVFPAVLVSRAVYVVFHPVEYGNLLIALFRFSDGGFWLPGAVAAVWPVALLLRKTPLTDDPDELLDAMAPGLAFFAGMVRLSAVFGGTCRSMYVVTVPVLQHYPFAERSAGAGGAIWHFATFFVSALLMFILMIASLVFYMGHHADRMKKPCSRHGNVAKLMLVMFCAIELVLDSTRADRTVLTFRLLRFLNRQMREISVTQIFCAAVMFAVMFYYSICAGSGKKKNVILRWLLFGGGLACVAVTEALVQRYTGYALLLTLLQALGSGAMAAGICLSYSSCREQVYS